MAVIARQQEANKGLSRALTKQIRRNQELHHEVKVTKKMARRMAAREREKEMRRNENELKELEHKYRVELRMLQHKLGTEHKASRARHRQMLAAANGVESEVKSVNADRVRMLAREKQVLIEKIKETGKEKVRLRYKMMHERWQSAEHRSAVDHQLHAMMDEHEHKQHDMLNAALSRNRDLSQKVEDLQAQMSAALFPVGLRIPTEEKAGPSFWDQSLIDGRDGADDGMDVESSTTEDESEGYWETYIVRVLTGKIRGAGTDANVAVQLYGDSDDSGSIPLEQSEHRNKFEKGQTDTFHITCRPLGKLVACKIGHDATGFGSGWFLDEVVVDNETEGLRWYFPCHRWLDKDEDDGCIERVLSLGLEIAIADDRAMSYIVKVTTGKVRGAGTDANVFVSMFGNMTDSGPLALDRSEHRNKFEAGQTDTFKLGCRNLGRLEKIRIGHDSNTHVSLHVCTRCRHTCVHTGTTIRGFLLAGSSATSSSTTRQRTFAGTSSSTAGSTRTGTMVRVRVRVHVRVCVRRPHHRSHHRHTQYAHGIGYAVCCGMCHAMYHSTAARLV